MSEQNLMKSRVFALDVEKGTAEILQCLANTISTLASSLEGSDKVTDTINTLLLLMQDIVEDHYDEEIEEEDSAHPAATLTNQRHPTSKNDSAAELNQDTRGMTVSNDEDGSEFPSSSGGFYMGPIWGLYSKGEY